MNTRSIRISISNKKGVQVNAPFFVSDRTIYDLVQEKSAWILKSLSKIDEQKTLIKQSDCENGEELLFLGQHYPFIKISNTIKPNIYFKDNKFFYFGTIDESLIHQSILSYFKSYSKTYLAQKTEHWAHIMNIPHYTLQVKEQKRIWGSCTSRNEIRLNYKLIIAPPSTIEYVIVHELAHIFEHNHSANFWAIVKKYIPDYKEQKNILKKYSPLAHI